MSLYDLLDLLGDFGDDGITSSHQEKSKPTVTRIIGIVLYAIVFFITIGNYIYKRTKAKGKLSTMATTFYICLPTFMLMRIVWLIDNLVLETHTNPGLKNFDSILNRVCMCVFLVAFNSLLFYWIDTSLTTVNTAFAKEAFGGSMEFGFMTPLGRALYYGSTCVVIILILVLCFVRVIMGANNHSSDSDYSAVKETAKQINDANNLIISIVYLVIGFLFLFFGIKLNLRISKGDKKLRSLWKTLLFSVGLCVCFLLRFIFFSLNIMANVTLNDNIFIPFTYYVPEIIPALLILWSVNTKMFGDSDDNVQVQDDEFVDPLLEELRDDEMREPTYDLAVTPN